MAEIKVSCLCITEGRPSFMPWLLWCYDRQDWPNRELVIVDSSPEPFQVSGRDDIRVITAEPGALVPKKRNLALQAARGDMITWFDDDDWQHPQKLSLLVKALSGGAPYAGSHQGWFVDLGSFRCTPYHNKAKRPIFNSSGFQHQVAQTIRFRENIRKASDTRWMQELAHRYPNRAVILDTPPLFFWLCHQTNLSNPTRRRQFAHDIEALKGLIGQPAWGDTTDVLKELKMRLENEKKDNQNATITIKETHVDTVAENNESEADTPDIPVSVVIKATVMDAPYLDVMVRHMIAQAQYPFTERAIIVDHQLAPTGKYRRRPRANRNDLEQVLEQLLADNVIDQVREVDMADSTVHRIMGRYWRNGTRRVPTHATTGGPIYATLFGLEAAPTDYVLQMDADVFFHTGPESWVRQALGYMAHDPSLWLMMTHPGPPAGPPGQSLGWRNADRATWDRELGIWRYRHATTRYFLCDRRKLRRRLRPLFQGSGCAPLERCISATLQHEGAFRGTLGDLESWHLHAWHHGSPFPEWAFVLAEAVTNGCFPALQQGKYDLRLDRAASRHEWQTLLQQLDPDGPAATSFVPPKQTAIPVKQARKNGHAQPKHRKHVKNLEIMQPAENLEQAKAKLAPISVIIPIRDRAGQRVLNALRGLNWQSAGRPSQLFVVSHGSQPELNHELEEMCRTKHTTLIKFGSPHDPWNKSLALNVGIRATSPEIPFIMTMDTDMILAPNFLAVVLKRLEQDPSALVLCRISDLPRHVTLPTSSNKLLDAFDSLYSQTRLRKRSGSGGIQAAKRDFFFDIRGYDEDLLWWGAMDGDILNRAQLMGLEHAWIEEQTAMLHQFHPRKHRVLNKRHEILEAKKYWRRNHQLVQARAQTARRNPHGWGTL